MPHVPDKYGITIGEGFPEADSATMIEIDVLMCQTLGIGLPLMKENAARATAYLASQRYFPEGCVTMSAVVLAGKGGNGDIALLAARRMADWGLDVSVVLACPRDDLRAGPAHEAAILDTLGIPVLDEPPPGRPDLIVDGLIGYSLRGAPRGRVAELVRWARDAGAPVLAIDAPTGLDGQSGTLLEPAIRADATIALGLPRRGLTGRSFAHVVGDLYLADIAVPRTAWARLTEPLSVPVFCIAGVVRILRPGEEADIAA